MLDASPEATIARLNNAGIKEKKEEKKKDKKKREKRREKRETGDRAIRGTRLARVNLGN